MMTDNAKRNFSTVLMVVIVSCWSGLFYLHYKAMHEKVQDTVLKPAEKYKILDDHVAPTKATTK